MGPFAVHNLKGKVLVGRARGEADDDKARLILNGRQRERRRLGPVNKVWVEDIEFVAWGLVGGKG